MKIFLLDFDGVVTDTLPIAVEVYNALMKKYSVPHQFTHKGFSDLFLDNFHVGLAKTISNDEIREKILKERAEEYIRRKDDFRVFDGIADALEELSRGGREIVISSNRTSFIKELLKSKNISCIDEVLGDDIEKSKVAKITWQKEKYPDSDIYYVGDTTGDIKEGKKTGVKTVGVTWGFHSRDVLEEQNPDFLFDKPSDLLTLLSE